MCLRCQNKTLLDWYFEKFNEGVPPSAIVDGLGSPGGNDKTLVPFSREQAEQIVQDWINNADSKRN
jgi:hypothetical protein